MLTKNALNVKKYIKLTKEEFDGSGYPFGYTADKIDDISAIITIADVYDIKIAAVL